MKFSTAFLAGAVVGGYLIYNMTPQQRERVANKAGDTVDRVKSSSVAKSLTNNLGDVAGAASDRVAGVVDTAGSAISDSVAPTDDTPDPTITV